MYNFRRMLRPRHLSGKRKPFYLQQIYNALAHVKKVPRYYRAEDKNHDTVQKQLKLILKFGYPYKLSNILFRNTL